MTEDKCSSIGLINVRSNVECAVIWLTEMVSALIPGSKSAIKFHDFPIDVPRQRQVDNSLARKKLNWVPQVF